MSDGEFASVSRRVLTEAMQIVLASSRSSAD